MHGRGGEGAGSREGTAQKVCGAARPVCVVQRGEKASPVSVLGSCSAHPRPSDARPHIARLTPAPMPNQHPTGLTKCVRCEMHQEADQRRCRRTRERRRDESVSSS
eukprot:357975-Chlamydomonas_euryale.AAC.3